MSEKRKLILKLYEIGCLKFGKFKLSSGIESPFYFNLRILPMYPTIMKNVAKLALEVLSKETFDLVVGIATGGIPLAAYISCLGDIPMTYVRKEEKKHGLQRLVEADVNGKKVVIIDDVATTGSTLLKAVKSVQHAGGIVKACFVVIDREQGAKERLSRENIRLISLLTTTEIVDTLRQEKMISDNMAEIVINYIKRVRLDA